MSKRKGIKRRSFLKGMGIGIFCGLYPIFGLASDSVGDLDMEISFINAHTSETLTSKFMIGGKFIKDELVKINHIMRDHRTGEIKAIDRKLLVLLYKIKRELNTNLPFHIISGYRSPKTNGSLHKNTSGVACGSQHILGKAIDIRIVGIELKALKNVAMKLKLGGVGFYPDSDFVHVDVGRVRSW